MTTLREAAMAALEELDCERGKYTREDVADALRLALAAQEPVPVAWMAEFSDGSRSFWRYKKTDLDRNGAYTMTPLYASPPTRTPMTEEQAIELYRASCIQQANADDDETTLFALIFARAVEAFHQITGSKG